MTDPENSPKPLLEYASGQQQKRPANKREVVIGLFNALWAIIWAMLAMLLAYAFFAVLRDGDRLAVRAFDAFIWFTASILTAMQTCYLIKACIRCFKDKERIAEDATRKMSQRRTSARSRILCWAARRSEKFFIDRNRVFKIIRFARFARQNFCRQ